MWLVQIPWTIGVEWGFEPRTVCPPATTRQSPSLSTVWLKRPHCTPSALLLWWPAPLLQSLGYCQRLDVCVTPKLICWIPNPQYSGVRQCGLWEGSRSQGWNWFKHSRQSKEFWKNASQLKMCNESWLGEDWTPPPPVLSLSFSH